MGISKLHGLLVCKFQYANAVSVFGRICIFIMKLSVDFILGLFSQNPKRQKLKTIDITAMLVFQTIHLFTNMAAMTSGENRQYKSHVVILFCFVRNLRPNPWLQLQKVWPSPFCKILLIPQTHLRFVNRNQRALRASSFM